MKIISAQFMLDNRLLDYEDKKDLYQLNDLVIIDNSQIKEVAKVIDVYKISDKGKFKNQKGEGKILKKVTPKDKEKINKNKNKATSYIPKCEEKIKKYRLAMRVTDANLSFDEKKLAIYFSAESRIDFRALVADFVRSFKKMIRLQQIGSREQIKRIGGVGKCGQEVCCVRFLKCPESVTKDFVKRQNLSEVGGSKINGLCGRLMCCLKYEDEIYTEIIKDLPALGSKIKTKQGIGKVIKQNIFSKSVIVELENKEKVEVKNDN